MRPGMPPNPSNSSSQRPREHSSSSRGPSEAAVNGNSSSRTLMPTPEELEEMNRCKVTPALLDYVRDTPFPYIQDVSKYEKIDKIGQGTFGEVFKARCRKTKKIVALKKILLENEQEGFPITALREVKMLLKLKHDNITDLIEVCSNKTASNPKDRSTFFLVFAFCDHDLAGILANKTIHLSVPHIKTLLKHLLSGLAKLHRSKVMHRDMKAANVLISREGILKLADFGLARPFAENRQKNHPAYTNRVVTLWYRPPELLLGARQYTTSIDIWGAGCIMAELWVRRPIMQGDTEQKQLQLITALCGSISPTDWPSVTELPLWGKVDLGKEAKRSINFKMHSLIKDEWGIALLDDLLALDPSKRPSAQAALERPYFFNHPHPKENVKDLMDTIKTSMFELNIGRNRPAGPGPKNPPGQYHDMVF